ncbi:O-antigen/teichoic acid export membrane protein [Povalibacter uvarum]|uniref:O-antigen/teichoic acid export membrane protein n=1 Tax=Povalibacter uvarum TaxID=732238 RepID=A0A841HSS1_9GAMM|nr:hypothetical protein [Povalibacter uvarum]MBB6095823.1 O-antigen/teichoic acid export membrane protein [Povalibacter uvarum]
MQYLGMVLYVATTGAAVFLLSRFDIPEPWRYLVAGVAVLPALLIVFGMLRTIRRQDELFQRVQFEAIALAAAVVWLFTFSWGALEFMQLVPRLPAYVVATGIVFLYGFGGWWFRRRYQ